MDSCSRLTRSAAKAKTVSSKTPVACAKQSSYSETADTGAVFSLGKGIPGTPVIKASQAANDAQIDLGDIAKINDQQCVDPTVSPVTPLPEAPVQTLDMPPLPDVVADSESMVTQTAAEAGEEQAIQEDASAEYVEEQALRVPHAEDSKFELPASCRSITAPTFTGLSPAASPAKKSSAKKEKPYNQRLTVPAEEAGFMSSTKAFASKTEETCSQPPAKPKVKSMVVTAAHFDSRSIKQLKKEIKAAYAAKELANKCNSEEEEEEEAHAPNQELQDVLASAMNGLKIDRGIEPLKGLPLPEGTHVRFGQKVKEVSSPECLDSAPNSPSKVLLQGLPEPCGTHTRFD